MYKNLILIHDNVKDKQIFYDNCLSDTCPIYIDSTSIKTESDLIGLIGQKAGDISKVENIGIVFWNTGNRIEILEYSDEELAALDKYNEDLTKYNEEAAKPRIPINEEEIKAAYEKGDYSVEPIFPDAPQMPLLPPPPAFPETPNVFSKNLLDVSKILKMKNTISLRNIDLITCNMFYSEEFNELAEIGVDVRYSTDITGISGNWILESHNVNITPIYFKQSIEAYPHNLDLPAPPLEIGTAAELYCLMASTTASVLQNKSYRLTANIDMSGFVSRSIGSVSVPYYSNFDGSGYEIKIANVNTIQPYNGLFSIVIRATSVSLVMEDYRGIVNYDFAQYSNNNLILSNIEIKNLTVSYSEFGNTQIIGNSVNKYMCGGLVGLMTYGKITNCNIYYKGITSIQATTTSVGVYGFCGGFIGLGYQVDISGCNLIGYSPITLSLGPIKGYLGGFAGAMYNTIVNCNVTLADNSIITASYTMANRANHAEIAGLCARFYGTLINNCSVTFGKNILLTCGITNETLFNIAGLIANTDYGSPAEILSSYVLFGDNCSILGVEQSNGNCSGTTAGFIGRSMFTVNKIENCYVKGGNNITISAGINTRSGSRGYGGASGFISSGIPKFFKNSYVELGNNATIAGSVETDGGTGGIIGFANYNIPTEVFNVYCKFGNNCTLKINRNTGGNNGNVGGLIGATEYCQVFGFQGYFGDNTTIAGYSYDLGTICNVGGIIGYCSFGAINSCTAYFGNNIIISGGIPEVPAISIFGQTNGNNSGNVGGICGNGNVTNCNVYFKDNIIISGGNYSGNNKSYCGGIAGYSSNIISCLAVFGNNITITGGYGYNLNDSRCAGIAGYLGTTCNDTYVVFNNNVEITGGKNPTAIANRGNAENKSYIGGLFASNSGSCIRNMAIFGNYAKLSGGKGDGGSFSKIGGLFGVTSNTNVQYNFAIYGDNTIFTAGEGIGSTIQGGNNGSIASLTPELYSKMDGSLVIFGKNYTFTNYYNASSLLMSGGGSYTNSYALAYTGGIFIDIKTTPATIINDPIPNTKSVQTTIFSLFDRVQNNVGTYIFKWLKYLIFIRQKLIDTINPDNTFKSDTGDYSFIQQEQNTAQIEENNTIYLDKILDINDISQMKIFKSNALLSALSYSYQWYIVTTYGVIKRAINTFNATIPNNTPIKFLGYDRDINKRQSLTGPTYGNTQQFTLYNFISDYDANDTPIYNGNQYYFIPSLYYSLNIGFNTFNFINQPDKLIYIENVTNNTRELAINDIVDISGNVGSQTTTNSFSIVGLYYVAINSINSSFYKVIPTVPEDDGRGFAQSDIGGGGGGGFVPPSKVCPTGPNDPYALPSVGRNPITYNISGDVATSSLTDSDKLAILFKKYQGFANTNTQITNSAVEYPINAFPFNLSNKVAIDSIPTTGIPSTQTIDSAIDPSLTSIYSTSVFTRQAYGPTNGYRYVWNPYCHIAYYSKLLLSPVPTNPGRSFFFYSMGYNMLTQIIPPNTVTSGYTYFITVEKKITVSGTSYWVPLPAENYVLDKDAGIITIYEENSEINGTNPPRISFWRYEGKLLSDPGAIIGSDVLTNSILYKDKTTGAIKGSSLLTIDPDQQTVNIAGHITLTGIVDPLGVVLIPTPTHPLTITDSRYPYIFWYSSNTNKPYFGDKALLTYDPLLTPDFKGPTGSIGAQGLQGFTGPQGFTGDRGIDGIIGRDGDTGTTGPTGDKGIDGIIGRDGVTGAQGFTGMMGPQGPPGSGSGSGGGGNGDTGPTGYTGPTGIQGVQGFTGALGPQGFTGSTVGVNELYVQPQAPTAPTHTNTTIQININWTNPEQKQLSFLPVKVPLIKDLHITLEDSTTPTPNIITIYNSTITDPYISTLIISNQSGTSQQSGTIYTWYKNTSQIEKPFKVTIWYTNYSTDTSNKMIVDGLEFATGGAPSIPINITINTNTTTSTQATLVVSPGQYTDLLLQNNLPTISTYNFIYKALSSERRGGLVVAAADLTTTSPTTAKVLTGLYAGTTYEATVSATNSLGSTSEYLTPRIQFTTKLPALGNTIQTVALSSYYSSVYSTGYNNGTQITNPIMYNDALWPSTDNISTIYITDGPAVTASNIGVTVNNGVSDSNNSVITFTLSAGGTNTVSNGADGKIILTANSTTTDPYTGGNSGFYWQSDLKAQIGQGTLIAGVGQQTLKFTQLLTGSLTSYTRNITFLVDSLPLNTAPTITDFQITDSSTKEPISGVLICPGAWSLGISNIQTQNVVRYFHAQKLLTYSFANSSNKDLLTTFQGTGSTSNTFLTSGITLTPTAQDTVYRYKPSITVVATNINTTNNTGELQKQIDIILDKPSKDIKSGYSVTNQTPNGITPGERVKTSLAAYSEPQLQAGRTDFIATYSQFRNAYDDTKVINTVSGTEGCNDLQLLGGNFITKSYNGLTGSYANYGTGLDYTQIAATGYRWTAFRWKLQSGQMSSLIFTIQGLKGTAVATVQQDSITPKILLDTTKELKFYYRIENQADSGGTGNPSDIESTQNAGGGISTVWVDANSSNEQSSFGKYMGVRQYAGILGGVQTRNKISITGTTNKSIEYNVTTPTFQLGSSANVYIYAVVGLPMDVDIAFTGVRCTATFSS